MKLSPNNPILLNSSLHVDEARKAISDLVIELIEESKKLVDPSNIELVPLDQAINRILAQTYYPPSMCQRPITRRWMAMLSMVIALGFPKIAFH